MDDVPEKLLALYRKSVQPLLISMMRRDPAAEVGKLGCPVLVVTGTHDVRIPVADGERLAAGAKGTRHATIKG